MTDKMRCFVTYNEGYDVQITKCQGAVCQQKYKYSAVIHNNIFLYFR